MIIFKVSDFTEVLFFIFGTLMIWCALLSTLTRDMIQAVFFLIGCFLNSIALLFLLHFEFIAIMYLMIYVGAIAVLFLFIVMTMNVTIYRTYWSKIYSIQKSKEWKYLKYFLFLVLIIFITWCHQILISEVPLSGGANQFQKNYSIIFLQHIYLLESFDYIELSNVLYTKYVFSFLISGLIIFIGMLGVIISTINEKVNFRQQRILRQILRGADNTIISR